MKEKRARARNRYTQQMEQVTTVAGIQIHMNEKRRTICYTSVLI